MSTATIIIFPRSIMSKLVFLKFTTSSPHIFTCSDYRKKKKSAHFIRRSSNEFLLSYSGLLCRVALHLFYTQRLNLLPSASIVPFTRAFQQYSYIVPILVRIQGVIGHSGRLLVLALLRLLGTNGEVWTRNLRPLFFSIPFFPPTQVARKYAVLNPPPNNFL
ncbi:Uncharacterised protein [Candidatus Anstonella stagnisolia]|nr:Uncharacterised protein [Candidatus Anstonella stagnisolia]